MAIASMVLQNLIKSNVMSIPTIASVGAFIRGNYWRYIAISARKPRHLPDVGKSR